MPATNTRPAQAAFSESDQIPPKPPLRHDQITDSVRSIELHPHAKERIEERGVGVMEIYSALQEPDTVTETKHEGKDALLHTRGDIIVVLYPKLRQVRTVIDRYEKTRVLRRIPLKPVDNSAGLNPATTHDILWATVPHSEPSARPMLVTPSMAAKLLEREPTGEIRNAAGMRNRKTREPEVDFYSLLLRSGEFVLIHEGAALDVDACLLDAKHRLLAVVRTGIPAPLFVTVGLPREAYPAIGTGRPRSLADVVYMRGQDKDTPLTASVARLVILFKTNGALDAANNSRRRPRITHAQILNRIDADPELMGQAVAMGKSLSRACRLIPSAGATGYYLIREACRQHPLVDPFFDHLNSGAQLDLGDPRLTLRDQIFEASGERYRDNTKQLALLIKAWNAYATDRPAWQLSWRSNERMPGVFVPPPADDGPAAGVIALPDRAARGRRKFGAAARTGAA